MVSFRGLLPVAAIATLASMGQVSGQGNRNVFLPDGCYWISDPSDCCASIDAREGSRYYNQPCLRASPGTTFSSGNVCEPECWVHSTCKEHAGLSLRYSREWYRQHEGACVGPDGSHAPTISEMLKRCVHHRFRAPGSTCPTISRSDCAAHCASDPACTAWSYWTYLSLGFDYYHCHLNSGPIKRGSGPTGEGRGSGSRSCFVKDDADKVDACPGLHP